MVQQKLVGGWEQLEPLGEGGQSKVFLVRNPGRVQERKGVIQDGRALSKRRTVKL